MYLKITLSILMFSLVACSTTTPKVTNKTTVLKQDPVRTLLDGTWIVRQVANTTIPSRIPQSRYFDYFSGLHANTIGCKSYSQIELKVRENEKAYKCVANGTYLTKNSIAIR